MTARDRFFRGCLVVGAAVFAGFLLLPLVALLRRAAPAEVWRQLGRPEVWSAVRISLWSATLATILIVLCGLPAAYLLARPRGWLGRALAAALELPLVLPPAVAGLALLLAFGRRQWLGGALAAVGIDEVALTPAAVVMAQILVAAPLFFRAARQAFAAVPERLRQASAVLGAGDATTFARISLPLARRGIAGGALLAWARAVGELGATLMFAGSLAGVTRTMPSAVFEAANTDLDAAVTLALVLLLVAGLALAAARRLEREVG